MQNDKLALEVQKIALDFFLFGKEPPVIEKKEIQPSITNSSPNISSSSASSNSQSSSFENIEFKIPKSKSKFDGSSKPKQISDSDKKTETSQIPARFNNNEEPKSSTGNASSSAKKGSLEESSQLEVNTFRSFKQKTSRFINIEAGEVDESAVST